MIAINYVVLDAARMNDRMDEAKQLNSLNSSLFSEKGDQYLQTVAPYLFSYELNTEFAFWLREHAWGNSWGYYICSRVNNEQLSRHFRNFNTVLTEDGSELYFRYYDPRVLRMFLVSCDVLQLTEFFGPIEKFVCEDEDHEYALIFSFDGRRLIKERVKTDTIFTSGTTELSNVEKLPAKRESSGNENGSDLQTKPPRWFSK